MSEGSNGETERRDVKEYYKQVADEYDERHYSEDPDGYPQNKIRRDFTIERLLEREVSTVLDAGCGDGSVMLPMLQEGLDVRGFDFVEEMVQQAREKLDEAGYDTDRVKQADITEELPTKASYDAVIALGVFPHLSDTVANLERIYETLEPGGVFMAEFRNDLFDLFTLNEYSYEFYKTELLDDVNLPTEIETAVDQRLRDAFNVPAISDQSESDDDELRYADVYSTFSNPFIVEEQIETVGFEFEEFYFYHYHALPPEFEERYPEEFRDASLQLEDPTDWRGYFMSSAFVVEATK